jgi:hypothetical protein
VLATALAPSAAAQNLAGSVTNGTTEKPAAGVEVTLITLAQGMQEAGSTKTDSRGAFSFKLADSNGPHLIRATYQGATYFKMAPPGTPSVDVTIFDSAKKIDGLSYTVDVLKLQAEGNQLHGTRLFAVNNQSKPPRTQMGETTFQFYLPEGAKISSTMAKAPNGQPVKAAVTPQKERNLYAFAFPLRPGETQMQIAFDMPYTGALELNPKSPYPLEHFVVMLPPSMKFEAMSTSFQTIKEGPGTGSANVQVATQAQPGQSLAFKIAGTGTLPPETENAGGGQSPGAGGPGSGSSAAGSGSGSEGPNNGGPTGQGMSSRPGGGLGAPIDAPDPLENFRWWILGSFMLLLVGGGYYVTQRNKRTAALANGGGITVPTALDPYSTPTPFATTPTPNPGAPARPAPTSGAAASGSPSLLLQAMKEELFQLEMDRQQGHISKEEYETHKMALDQTLARAIQRESRKT